MPAVVVFIIFVICLVIAIPVSISLGIASVLPGTFDPSFTASGTFVVRSMLGGQLPPPCGSYVRIVGNHHGKRRHFPETF